jgi:hypothetical protein
MALPIQSAPTFFCELPSDGTEVKFRPFLVKEQRNLLLTKEDPNQKEITENIITLLTACTFEKLDISKLSTFDVEYLFLQVRSKSVGETVKLNLPCQKDDTHPKVELPINLADVSVDKSNMIDNTVMINDEIGMVLKYPTLMESMNISENDESQLLDVMKKCIVRIFDNEEVHEMMETPDSEIESFLDGMTIGQLEKVGAFFTGAPNLSHTVTYKCPECETEQSMTIRGLENFF